MYDEDYYRESMRRFEMYERWLNAWVNGRGEVSPFLKPQGEFYFAMPQGPQPKPKRIATEEERAHWDLVLARLEAKADQVDALIEQVKIERVVMEQEERAA